MNEKWSDKYRGVPTGYTCVGQPPLSISKGGGVVTDFLIRFPVSRFNSTLDFCMPTSALARATILQRISPGLLFVLFGFVLFGMSGCSSSDHIETVSVEGVVTYQGMPVAAATVFFVPESGPRASGDTDNDGRYSLMTYNSGDGAIPGDFRVGITKFVLDPTTKDEPVPSMMNMVPDKYSNPATSGLSVKVESAKDNKFPFELTD